MLIPNKTATIDKNSKPPSIGKFGRFGGGGTPGCTCATLTATKRMKKMLNMYFLFFIPRRLLMKIVFFTDYNFKNIKWSHLGSNQGPSDYESDALTN